MIELFKDLNKSQLLKLLAIIALSDGYIDGPRNHKKELRLMTHKDSIQQHILLNYLSNKAANKKAVLYRNKPFLTSRIYSTHLINDLLKLSPSYKTSPYKESKKEFLNSPQPSLKFILNSKNKNLKQLALRIYFDFDGSIIPSFKIKNKKDKKKGKIYQYYQIQFECDINIAETNPKLARELLTLCKMLNLNAIIKGDRRKWSGIDGIRISGLEDVKRFIRFGGPITDVKISSKSYRLKGTTKKTVCKGVMNVLNKNIPLSYYFKNYEDALNKKEESNKLLMDEIKKCI